MDMYHKENIKIERKIRILSWDVGIYNLAYCLLEFDSSYIKDIVDINDINSFAKMCNIRDWGIITLISPDATKTEKKKYNLLKVGKSLFEQLDDKKKTSFNEIDYVLIENQPCLKNPKMKSIQMMLYSYFIMRGLIDCNMNKTIIENDNTIDIDTGSNMNSDDKGICCIDCMNGSMGHNHTDSVNSVDNINDTTCRKIDILFISASGKLKYCKDKEIDEKFNHLKSKYTRRKKMAIEYCKLFMQHDSVNIDLFNSHKKKDDLADSYLQGVQYLFKNRKSFVK